MRRYRDCLNSYLDAIGYRSGDKPREEMRSITTALGMLGGGPRDLIDLHLAALEGEAVGSTETRVRASATEGRLLAIEMMGLLVEHYRTGARTGGSMQTVRQVGSRPRMGEANGSEV